MNSTASRPERSNPRAHANPLSVLCFWWTKDLFVRGWKHDLKTDDLYDVLPADASDSLGDRLDKHWRKEQSAAREAQRPPSLTRALAHAFWWTYSLFGIALLFHAIIVRVAYPLFLGRLVTYFSPDTTTTKASALWYAGGLVLASALNVLFMHHNSFGTQVIGMRIRIACSSLIYRKVLRLSQGAIRQTAVGQMINLLSNDVSRFDQLPLFLHYVWVMPLQTIVITYFIWEAVGVSAFIGVGSLFLQTVPVQSYLSKLTSQFRLKVAKRTDERVRLMNEIISGIQVIKMYAWEKPFEKMVEIARIQEIKVLCGASYLRGVYLAFMVFSERTSLFFTLLAYVLLGNDITADKVFMLAQFYNVLQASMAIFYPQAVQMAAEASVSVKRVETFLLQEESLQANKNGLKNKVQKAERLDMVEKERQIGISVTGLRARWIPNSITDTLANISIRVPPGKLCAVIGPVGAGKSSLMYSLLQELPSYAGDVTMGGTIAYASQEPWLFAGTIRNNILFGRPYDSQRYREVIRCCALTRDLQLLPQGEKTVVGDRGAALSGGQRARINFARAVYQDADIYLLDDPLSAVDAHVGKQLFDECISTYLSDKTRILVTHQLQYLKNADLIVIINNGQVEAQGTYKELAASKMNFAALLNSGSDDDEHKMPTRMRQMSVISANSTGDADKNEDDEDEIDETTEMIAKGTLSSSLYVEYFRAGSNIFLLVFVAFLLILGQIAASGCDFWVTFWTNQEEAYRQEMKINKTMNILQNNTLEDDLGVAEYLNMTTIPPDNEDETPIWNEEEITTIMPILKSLNITNRTYIEPLPPLYNESRMYVDTQEAIIIYSICIIGCVIFTILRSIAFFKVSMNSSKGLHDTMFASVIRATMRFFFTNPAGRILNRFSKDMGTADEQLPKAMLEAIQVFLVMTSILVMVIIVNVYFILVVIVVGVIFYQIRKIYLATAQDVKRLEGVTKSPVFSHLTAALQGLTTIRASQAEEMLIKEFDNLQDQNSSCWYMWLATSAAFGFCLDCFSCLFVASVTFSFLIADDGTSGGYVGLAISQSLILTGMLQHGMRLTADVVNQMTSVERVLQYTTIEQESPFESEPGKKPQPSWPQKGELVFDHMSLRYAQGAPPVLRDLNFSIEPGYKVGIVGRTGAGKSSLIAALFRLAPVEGAVHLDKINTQLIGLHDLRRNISIIPQEPVLFSATLRYNLNPFAEYPDAALWNALEEVELKDVIDTLDMPVTEGGTNFSVGQRQLICLARAILKNNKVLVLDEATANVDPQTDAFIQETIRRKFRQCTVLTIAHRLNTIMDSDKVLVMEAGEAVEYDHPHILLQNKDGYFYSLVQETGHAMAEELSRIAEEAYNKTMQSEVKTEE